MKKLFPGLDSAAIIRGRSRHRTFLRRPPEWAPFAGPTPPFTEVNIFYQVKSGQDRVARFYGAGPTEFVEEVANRIDGAGFGIPWGGTFFNASVVTHLRTIEAI